jgi:hypothetical protein
VRRYSRTNALLAEILLELRKLNGQVDNELVKRVEGAADPTKLDQAAKVVGDLTDLYERAGLVKPRPKFPGGK